MAKDYIEEVIVKNKTYMIETCSAKEQRTIMLIFSKYSLNDVLKNIALTHSDPDISQKITATFLFANVSAKASDSEIDYLFDTLLQSVFLKGTDNKLTVDDFRDRMDEYSLLLMGAIEANFKGFTSFLNYQ